MITKGIIEQFTELVSKTKRIDNDVINGLMFMGYFDAPASKGHHLAEPGGLAKHSVGVANKLRLLTDRLGLIWQDDDSPEVIGLLHDLCKCDLYIPHVDENGFTTYTYNDKLAINGHGDKSIIQISSIMKLTRE